MFITVKLNTGEMTQYLIEESKCIVGRSPKCQVVIPHEGLSRQHCLIEIENGEIFVTDLDSTNGVFIDGTRISPSQKTEFKSYLPLSFGPVDSLLVEFEKPEEGTLKIDNIYEAKKPVNTRVMKEKQKPAPKAAAKSNDDLQYKILAAIVIAMFVAFTYWYLENKNATISDETTTEEVSED